ncbi:MAG: helix-turn-helix transcriptional regulator [Selenomonadaceae bacterium]|nr:helix-turn-helix transcriptional regulator [Selenomonadaceae bacterium]
MDITAYRLRELREKKGLSQREVAERIGVTRAAYNKYECGASKPIRRLNMLSALFGVSADYILGKNETDFESEVHDVNPKTHAQVKKYMRLSDFGKEIVDITLDAVFEREKEFSSNQS